MEAELKSLRIDRSKKRSQEPSPWATGWILGGIALILVTLVSAIVWRESG